MGAQKRPKSAILATTDSWLTFSIASCRGDDYSREFTEATTNLTSEVTEKSVEWMRTKTLEEVSRPLRTRGVRLCKNIIARAMSAAILCDTHTHGRERERVE
jgi:hypothetical protein